MEKRRIIHKIKVKKWELQGRTSLQKFLVLFWLSLYILFESFINPLQVLSGGIKETVSVQTLKVQRIHHGFLRNKGKIVNELEPLYTKRQRQRCNDASNIALIEKNAVAPKWVVMEQLYFFPLISMWGVLQAPSQRWRWRLT